MDTRYSDIIKRKEYPHKCEGNISWSLAKITI